VREVWRSPTVDAARSSTRFPVKKARGHVKDFGDFIQMGDHASALHV